MGERTEFSIHMDETVVRVEVPGVPSTLGSTRPRLYGAAGCVVTCFHLEIGERNTGMRAIRRDWQDSDTVTSNIKTLMKTSS